LGKGQLFSGEFLLAYVIFAVVLTMVLLLWTNTTGNINAAEEMYDMERLAVDVSEKLMKTPGFPEDWTTADVMSVGLVNDSGDMDPEKVMGFVALMGNETNYEDNKHLLGIRLYEFYFYLENLSGSVVSVNGTPCVTGKSPVNETGRFTMKRAGVFNNTVVRSVLTVWR